MNLNSVGIAEIGSPYESADVVERVISRLNTMVRAATLEFAVSVGRLIISEFYGGCMATWRDRGAKDYSFRRLARHPQLPMSVTALYRSVAIYEVSQRVNIEQWKYVSMSHIRLVLPLAYEDQARLLQCVNQNHWTTRRLQQEIDSSPKRSGERAARNRRKQLQTTMRAIERCLVASDQFVEISESECEPSPESVSRARALLDRLRYTCLELERHLPGARTDYPPPVVSENPVLSVTQPSISSGWAIPET